ERQRQVRRHRIARHQIEQHQRILLEVFAVGARLLGVDLAVPAQVAADAQRRPLPRQLVAGEELERSLRDLPQQALAVGIFRLGARIAAADLPARQHLAGDFELEAFRYGAAFGAVRRLAIRIQWRVGNRHGEIILLYPKNRGAGIELAVVEFALDAGFVTGTFQWIEALAAGGLLVLRLEDIGVAGVGREILAEVDDDAGIRRDHAGFLGEGGGGSGAGCGSGPLGFLTVADAAAETDRYAVDR